MMDEEDDFCTDPIVRLKLALLRLQEDISEFMQEVDNKFTTINKNLGDMEKALEYLNSSSDREEENADFEDIPIPTEESSSVPNEDTLSDVAKLILCSAEGPLNPEDLKSFLIDKAWGKPKPSILPIARTYSMDIRALKNQLQLVKNGMKEVHNKYMTGPKRLDDNLDRRINTLLKNIDNELKKEEKENRCQTSISNYMSSSMTE